MITGCTSLHVKRTTSVRSSHEGFCRQDRGGHRRRHRNGPRTGAATGRRGLQRRHVRSLGAGDGGDQAALRSAAAAAGPAHHHASRRRVGRHSRCSGFATRSPSGRRPTRSICCSTMPASAAAAACSPTAARHGRGPSTSVGVASTTAREPFCRCCRRPTQAHIVNTSSVNGFWASVGPRISHTSYCAAKFAVKGFTEALITDLQVHAPHIKCSVVMPGHIGTSIVANSRKIHSGGDV